MLLFTPGKTADYICTGTWSQKAAVEAEKYGKVNMVIPKTKKYTRKLKFFLQNIAFYIKRYACELEV